MKKQVIIVFVIFTALLLSWIASNWIASKQVEFSVPSNTNSSSSRRRTSLKYSLNSTGERDSRNESTNGSSLVHHSKLNDEDSNDNMSTKYLIKKDEMNETKTELIPNDRIDNNTSSIITANTTSAKPMLFKNNQPDSLDIAFSSSSYSPSTSTSTSTSTLSSSTSSSPPPFSVISSSSSPSSSAAPRSTSRWHKEEETHIMDCSEKDGDDNTTNDSSLIHHWKFDNNFDDCVGMTYMKDSESIFVKGRNKKGWAAGFFIGRFEILPKPIIFNEANFTVSFWLKLVEKPENSSVKKLFGMEFTDLNQKDIKSLHQILFVSSFQGEEKEGRIEKKTVLNIFESSKYTYSWPTHFNQKFTRVVISFERNKGTVFLDGNPLSPSIEIESKTPRLQLRGLVSLSKALIFDDLMIFNRALTSEEIQKTN